MKSSVASTFNESRLLGKKLLLVTAHPDDETFTAAGTIYKNYQDGGETVVVCATMGERGSSHLKKKVTATQLKQIRKQELRHASKLLHIKKVYSLNLPDTQVKENAGSFLKSALKVAASYRPQIIVSFDETGLSGHLDHITAGKVAKSIAAQLKRPFVTFTASGQNPLKIAEVLQGKRRKGRYKAMPKYHKPNLTVAIDPNIKLRALRCHQSQYDVKNPLHDMPPEIAHDMLTHEYFVYRGRR